MIDIGLGLHVRQIEYSDTIPFIMGYITRGGCLASNSRLVSSMVSI